MADAFVGEIRLLPYTFPPVEWLWCNGTNLPVAQYQALYAVIGLIYGGTANVSFKIPNMQGTVPIGLGTAPGLTPRIQSANAVGATTVTLNNSQVPSHTHTLTAKYVAGVPNTAVTSLLANPATDSWVSRAIFTQGASNSAVSNYAAAGVPVDTTLPSQTITPGGGVVQPAAHENRQPFLPMNFCICAYGSFPLPNQ